MEEITWQGLDEKRFKKYRQWKNTRQPGICGSYVVSVLLHDFLLQHYGLDYSQKQLIQGVEEVVDQWMPYQGTFVWDLAHGLNYFLEKFTDHRAQTHLLPDLAIPQILSSDHPRPIAVGTAELLGSPYHNHWLVAYAYGYDVEGKLYFKSYDNHGRYQAVIPASKSIGCVWID